LEHTTTMNDRRIRRLTGALTAVVATVAVIAGLQTPAWAATTAISNQASASGFPVGSPIYDSASLGYGVNPTGSITFRMYGPADPSCAVAPLYTATTAVTANGYYESTRYTPTATGTYRWIAAYSGDANNSPSSSLCSDPGAAVTVSKRRVNLSAAAAVSGGGTTSTDTATLSSGAAPTGTLVYKVYGPDNMTCAGSPALIASQPVVGNGTYVSVVFTAVLAGTYRWTVNYSGDVNNLAASTVCTDPANAVKMIALVRVTVSGSPLILPRGGVLTASWSGITAPTSTDWIGLSAVGAPNSAIVAWRYTQGAASGSLALTVPWSTAPGPYELRLSANNSYTRLATSGTITVTA
jgi:hypothetical protein